MERQDHLRGGGQGPRTYVRACRRGTWLTGALALIASAFLLAVGSIPADADEAVIAVAGPMSGRYGAVGQQMRIGVERAVRNLNVDRAGTGKAPLRVVVVDDRCERTAAVEAAHRLVASGVALVVGHHCPGASIATAPIYSAAGIVQISPGTTAPAFTERRAGPTIFRLATRSDREGAIAGAWMARQFTGKRVAILHDRTLTGVALARTAKNAMNAAGLIEALYSGFVAGERDYGQLARDLKGYRIDVAYLGAFASEVRQIRDALTREGVAIALVGSSLLASGDDAADPARDLEGVALTAPPRSSAIPGARRLAIEGLAADLALLQAASYAAVEIWAAAAGDGASLVRNLDGDAAETVLGAIRFDKKGDPVVPFLLMHVWQGGQLQPLP